MKNNYCDCRQGRDPCTCKPVPPAGGDVEVAARALKIESLRGAFEQRFKLDIWPVIDWLRNVGIDGRTQVTRLQAEVESSSARLHEVATLCATVEQERDALQAELTKARELWATEQAIKEQPGEDVLWQVLDAAVGVITRRAYPHALESEAHNAGVKVILARRAGLAATAAHQSAPAAKDGDWHMNSCKQGHRDIGAAGGIAHCYQCDEKIEAATTKEAFERWNATHPKP